MKALLARLCTVSLLLLALGGCPEEPNQLEGSIDEVFALHFDEVRIRHYASTNELQIEYLREAEDGSAKDVVAQITITTPEGGIPHDVDITFEQVNGAVHRIAEGDDFPAISEGQITFFAGGNEIDEQTTGEFALIFENKRTLRGNFDAKLEQASAG